MDSVARLCPAARGGSLERDKAETTITCLDTQGHCHSADTGPKKQGWRAKGYRCTRSRVLVLAQSSREGPAPADLDAGTSAPGVTPRQARRDRQLSHPAKAMGKGPFSTSCPTFL